MNKIKIMHWFLLSLFIVTLVVSPAYPKSIQPITREEEVKMGRDIAANVIAQFGIYNNEDLTDYVNLVGLTLARGVKNKKIEFHFAILDSKIINAFAAPGGYIFITKGLLDILEDEAQLAGVLAHEIAHVSQRHVAKALLKVNIVEQTIPSYVKATAAKAKTMKQVTDLAIKISWKGLSREDELESDRLAVLYMSKAGYDPRAFKDILQLLHKKVQNPKNKNMKFLLSTHPKPAVRIQAVEKKLEDSDLEGVRLAERFSDIVKSGL